MRGLEVLRQMPHGTRAGLAALIVFVFSAAPAYADHDHDHRGGPPPQRGGGPGWKGQPGPAPQQQQQQQPHFQQQPPPQGGPGWRGPPQGPPQQPPRAQQPPPGPGWRGHQQGPPPPPQAQQVSPAHGGWHGGGGPPQRAYVPPERGRHEAQAWHQQGGWRGQGGGWQPHGSWREHRAQRWQNDHRTWAQRGGYGGYYIPRARFESRFGWQHPFRLHAQPVIYQGYPRFYYGGFSFLIVDPWPEYWGDNWYYNDDLFIGYDDGYYLYSRADPSVALAITVVP